MESNQSLHRWGAALDLAGGLQAGHPWHRDVENRQVGARCAGQFEQTYYRLHGTAGARHVHTDDELRQLRDLVDGRPSPYVMFNNLPRAGDAERFLALLAGHGG